MRVDWPTLLGDIAYLLGEPSRENPQVRIAVGTRALANYVAFDREAIRSWMAGAQPRHHDGEVLIVAWARITGKARDFVPMARPVYSAHKVTR